MISEGLDKLNNDMVDLEESFHKRFDNLKKGCQYRYSYRNKEYRCKIFGSCLMSTCWCLREARNRRKGDNYEKI